MMFSMRCSAFKIAAETLQLRVSRSFTRQCQLEHGRRWWQQRLYN